MIALVAGFFLVSYLLAPGAIYRLAFSIYLPSKRLQRTRTEEIVFSAIITILPFIFTAFLLLHTPLGRHPEVISGSGKLDSYRAVLTTLVGDSSLKIPNIASAYYRSLVEQARFVLWLWILCAIEGCLAGLFVRGYGDYQQNSLCKAICDKFLLKHVSEWQVLFTTLPLSSKDPRRIVEVDALTGAALYKGRLVNWFTDTDGKLAGIFLENAARFRKEDLDRDRAAEKNLPVPSYWKAIPGANLYIPASSIVNYNVRYVEETESDVVADELGSDIVITPLEGPVNISPSH